MINFLKFNEGYENNIKKYSKKDGLLCLLFFIIFILAYSILAILNVRFDFVKNNILAFGSILNIILILIALVFVKLRGQTLDTIGLYKGKWKTSLIIGIILALIYLFNNCISYVIQGYTFIDIKKIGVYVIYYLLVSLCEEIAFRGYINTRINGIIKNKWFAIVLSGVLFIIMHFPYRMIAYGTTLQNLTIDNLGWIIDLFITHMIISIIYIRTNSIYGAIIPHWISNLSYHLISR